MNSLENAINELGDVFDKHGVNANSPTTSYDSEWRNDSKLIIEILGRQGIVDTLGALKEALLLIESERGNEDGENFYESQECKNLNHCILVIDHCMTACDLDMAYGYGKAREVAMERFKENIRELEMPQMLKEQA